MPVADFNHSLLTHADSLIPFAFTLTNNKEEAKDLYQETLFRALVYQQKYVQDTNIKAWLYTIMRNIFINNYRRKNRQYVVLTDTANPFFINSLNVVSVNEAITSINIKEIETEILKLPDIFKHPFVLHITGYKYTEIASILCEPIGTVKSRIHFARKLLKQHIQRS